MIPPSLHLPIFPWYFWLSLHRLLVGGPLAAWFVGVTMLLRGRRFYRPLADVPLSEKAFEVLPPLTIIVPACNEAATIERGMRSLMALDYPCLEIIAVNDRSTDSTGAILDRLAMEHPCLRVLHVHDLPPGWLGKNHALQLAGDVAKGEWLLFTDADVVLTPDSMRRAVAYARHHCVDHLVLSPRCETHGFWERLFVSYFGLMFSFRVRPWNVANPHKPEYVGLGAFNLVRAAAYRQIGGHRALPLEVSDDMKLGKIIKRNGFHQELLDGGDLLSVRWVVGLRGIIEGLTKNAFAGFEFKLSLVCAAIVMLALLTLYPAVALVLPPTSTRWLAAATLLIMAWGAGMMRRLTGANAWYGLAYPLASIVLIYILLRSTWHAYRQNGILWRGTLYPLDELKRGVV